MPKYVQFLYPEEIFISALQDLLQFQVGLRYACLHDFPGLDTQRPLVVTST
jgi:hypothetical protein